MIMGIAALIFVPLLTVSLAHFLWAFGASWPIRNPALLARTVIGRADLERVPRLASLVTAVAVLGAGILALSLADPLAGGTPLTVAGAFAAALFLARGVAGYTPQWRARFPLEPFATLDRRQYSPLCLCLGAGFALLVVLRLT